MTNLEEYELGTDPFNEDTDFDGLTDYDEVHIYGTDPLKYDTDEDGLSDGQEIELGTGPLNPDTDGNGILDGDEIYTIEKTPDVEFMDENIIPTITMDVAGNLIDSLGIYALSEDDIYLPSEMPGYLGAGYEFELGGDFKKGTLTFTFNSEFMQIENFAPAIYYYNEEEQFMEYLEGQAIDWEKCQVSSEINHFSKYILINNTEYLKVWEENIRVPWDNELYKPLDIVLVIDSSGSMSSNDPKGIRKQATKGLVDSLANNDRVAVVDFDSRAYLLTGFTNNKDKAKTAIDKIDSSGGTSLTAGIKMALEQFTKEPDKGYEHRDALKYIIMLTDGDGPYDHNLTKQARDNNVVIFTVGLGAGVKTTLLRLIAGDTLGKHFFASSAEGLIEEFEDIKGEVIDIEKDSDKDGLPDYFERKLRYSNGIRINTDPYNPDTDGDGLKDGQEIEIRVKEIKQFGQPIVRVYAKMNSHPLMRDTDGDGLRDGIDPEKLCFNITDRTLALAAKLSYTNLKANIGEYIGHKSTAELSGFQVVHANNSGIWIPQDYFDRGLGSVAIRIRRPNKNDAIIFAFRGTEAFKDPLDDFYEDALLGVGLGSIQSLEAFKEYKWLVKKYPNCDFFLAGHSLGGRLVQDVLYNTYNKNTNIFGNVKNSIKTPIHSATFNALGYNKSQYFRRGLLKQKNINQIEGKLNNYYYKYDLVGEGFGNSLLLKRLGTDIGPYRAKDKDGNEIKKPILRPHYVNQIHGIHWFCNDERLKEENNKIF